MPCDGCDPLGVEGMFGGGAADEVISALDEVRRRLSRLLKNPLSRRGRIGFDSPSD